jgi:hypothetical protein
MQVYVLTFDSRPSLTHAFDIVLAASDVASCMIEADRARIRFMAPDAPARKLVEQIYQGGGLLWCSRHSVVEGGGADARAG